MPASRSLTAMQMPDMPAPMIAMRTRRAGSVQRRVEQRARQAAADDLGGLGDDALDELVAGRDVVDEALDLARRSRCRRPGRPPRRRVRPRCAGDEVADVLERAAARSISSTSWLTALRATRAVLRSVRKIRSVARSSLRDDLLLDVVVDRRLGRAHEARAHVHRVGAERERGDQAARVGEAAARR